MNIKSCIFKKLNFHLSKFGILFLFFFTPFITNAQLSYLSGSVTKNINNSTPLNLCQEFQITTSIKNNSNIIKTLDLRLVTQGNIQLPDNLFYHLVTDIGDFQNMTGPQNSWLTSTVTLQPNQIINLKCKVRVMPFDNLDLADHILYFTKLQAKESGTNTYLEPENVSELQTSASNGAFMVVEKRPVSEAVNELIEQNPILSVNYACTYPQNIYIHKGLLVDVNYCIIGESSSYKSKIVFNETSDIQVLSGNTLDLKYLILSNPCSGLWKGITVQSGGTLIVDQCIFEGAEFGITALPGSTVKVTNTWFKDCNIGIYVPPSNGNQQNVNFTGIWGNKFSTVNGVPTNDIFTQNQQFMLAGISINNLQYIEIGKSGELINEFKNAQNGILSNKSNLIVNNNKFIDIVASPGFPTVGVAVKASGDENNYLFMGNTQKNIIENSEIGVLTSVMGDYIRGNEMTNVGTGIDARYTNWSDIIIVNNTIAAKNFGIRTYLNTTWWAQRRIENNSVTINGADNGTGIEVVEYHPFLGWQIKSNTAKMIKGDHGIAIYSDNSNIKLNTIDLTSLSDNSCNGISLKYAPFANIESNNSTGSFLNGFGDVKGVSIEGSPNSTINCNTLCGHTKGIHYFDLSDMTSMSTNRLYAHLRGLEVANYTSLDEQSLRGNLWYGPFSNGGFGAVHNGFSDYVGASLFKVNSQPNTIYWPTISTPNAPNYAWFNNEPGQQDVCGSYTGSSTCQAGLVGVINSGSNQRGGTTLRDAMRGGTYGYGSPFAIDLGWKGKSHYYDYLLTTNSTVTQDINFLNQEGISSVGRLTAVKQAIIQAAQPNNASSIQSGQLAVFNSLTTLSETAQTPAQRSATLQDLSAQSQTLSTAVHSAQQSRYNTLQQAALDNQAITTVCTADANEKTVNQIYLNWALQGFGILSTNTIQVLQSIAVQCPLSGGDAVYKARGILRGFGDYGSYDNEQICNAALPRESTQKQIVKAVVQPNPSNGEVNIFWSGETDNISVINTLGKAISVTKVENTTSQKLNLSHLQSGVYYIQIQKEGKVLQTLPFVKID